MTTPTPDHLRRDVREAAEMAASIARATLAPSFVNLEPERAMAAAALLQAAAAAMVALEATSDGPAPDAHDHLDRPPCARCGHARGWHATVAGINPVCAALGLDVGSHCKCAGFDGAKAQ